MPQHRSVEDVVLELDREGYAVVPDVLSADTVARLKADLDVAIEKEVAFHRGTEYLDYGMVLVCCTYARSFVDVLADEKVMAPLCHVLGDGCIVYAYTSSSMPPRKSNYSRRIHVDSPRMIPGYETTMGVVLPLDDFTAENGATWALAGSHRTKEPPTEAHFYANAKRILAPAGSAVYLNPRLWHAGGDNTTDAWRHAITISMCRPYMKQRLDIPKMMAKSGVDLTGVSERALQKMGFHAQVPESLEEYYQPPEKRKFRQKAE